MNESNYEKVVAAIPNWEPSWKCRVFSVTAIQEVVSVKFLEAVAIKKRLISEGVIPGDPSERAKADFVG